MQSHLSATTRVEDRDGRDGPKAATNKSQRAQWWMLLTRDNSLDNVGGWVMICQIVPELLSLGVTVRV